MSEYLYHQGLYKYLKDHSFIKEVGKIQVSSYSHHLQKRK